MEWARDSATGLWKISVSSPSFYHLSVHVCPPYLCACVYFLIPLSHLFYHINVVRRSFYLNILLNPPPSNSHSLTSCLCIAQYSASFDEGEWTNATAGSDSIIVIMIRPWVELPVLSIAFSSCRCPHHRGRWKKKESPLPPRHSHWHWDYWPVLYVKKKIDWFGAMIMI